MIRGTSLTITTTRNKTPLTAETLAELPDLRFISVLATGYNIVDVEAAQDRGIAVSNVPIYGTDAVAQFVFALLLGLCHHVEHHSAAVKQGRGTFDVAARKGIYRKAFDRVTTEYYIMPLIPLPAIVVHRKGVKLHGGHKSPEGFEFNRVSWQ